MKLAGFPVLTFDCYGTLIDWESGIIAALAPLTRRLSPPLARDRILEAHARHEVAQQSWTPARPYCTLLATVYRRIAEEWGLSASVADAEAYGASVGDWPAFPDTADALRYLGRFHKLVILSNVDNRSFERSAARLGCTFDAIYTAEDIGSYKPSDRNFAYMLAKLGERGYRAGDILHVAESLYHDHVPAKARGLATCWIHRRHAQSGFGATVAPGEMPQVDVRFTSMAEFVAAHRLEVAA